MSSLNYMELCRLCLVKDRVQIPIFEGEGDIRQIFLKIAACLPVKVKKDDKLPKKICDDCMYKVEMLYQFWNTTANAEKQLLEWLGEAVEEKKTESHVKTENLEQDPCSELAKSLSRVEAVLAEAREAESDNDNFASGKPETDSDDEPLSSLEPSTFVNVGLDASGATEPQTQGEFLAPGAPSTSKSINSTNAQAASGIDPLCSRDNLFADVLKYTKPEVESTFGEKEKLIGKKIGKVSKIRAVEVCKICDQIFKTRSSYEFHCKSVHGIDRPYTCGICNGHFKNSHILAGHKKLHSDKKDHNCDLCDFSCYSKHNLDLHKRRNHSKEFLVSCEICKKGFFSKVELNVHKNSHSGSRPYQCELCGKNYMSKSHLGSHKKWVHPELFSSDSYHKCPICLKTFPFARLLAKHLDGHAGTRKYLCDFCGKAVTSQESLKIHRRTHTGEKPIVCDICGKAFGGRYYMRVHRRLHTGEKPYSCTHCNKSFTQRSTLSLHLKSHVKNYKCCWCSVSFTSKKILDSHIKTHAK